MHNASQVSKTKIVELTSLCTRKRNSSYQKCKYSEQSRGYDI